MATEAKYRPSLTLAEIKALIHCAENCEYARPEATGTALQSLKLLVFKAELGTTQPSHIPTGNKTGRPSAADIMRADVIDSITPMEAATQIAMYQSLGQPIPAHLQRFLIKTEANPNDI